MDCILAAAVVILLLVIAALCVKIRLMQISAEEIRTAFHERLETDTNTLIGISGRDRALRRLASDINDQLRLLRAATALSAGRPAGQGRGDQSLTRSPHPSYSHLRLS